MKRIALLALLAAIPMAVAAQQHHDRKPEDELRVKPLSGGVYAVFGRGGNVAFFVGPEAVIVVDSQFRDLAPGIVKEIGKVTDKPIRYLVNTHHHGDHTGGNGEFVKISVIVAHDNVRKRMLASPANILKTYPAELEKARKKGDQERAAYIEQRIEWAKAVKIEEIAAPFLTFDSEFRIHTSNTSGETIHVWHTPPAHTDGDAVVYFEKANVVHMGDIFFYRQIPFIDVSSGGSARGYLAAIDRVLSRVPKDATVIPGHGDVTDVNGLLAFRKYIADLTSAAETAKSSGTSKEQFVDRFALPAYKDWQGYPDDLKDNAAAAYDEAPPGK
jgi:cyclase